MLRLKQLTNLLTYTNLPIPGYSRVLHKKFPNNLVLNRVLVRYKSDKDDPKKPCYEKDKDPITSHPSLKSTSAPTQRDPSAVPPMGKTSDKPPDTPPCELPNLDYIPKTPATHQCTPNEMSELPQPACDWKTQYKKDRQRYFRTLMVGLLFAAVTIGATAYHINRSLFKAETNQKEVVKKEKKKRFPATSSAIPRKVPYLLIGAGTASFSAFRAIKSIDPKAKVLLIGDEPFYPYMRPPLSKEIWFNDDPYATTVFKQWNGAERSLYYEPDEFYMDCQDLMESENGGVAVARGWTVSEIDPTKKKVILEDGKEIAYEQCLIATGATPKFIPQFELATYRDQDLNDRIKYYRNLGDFRALRDEFAKAQTVAVIGNGFLSSELACALARRGEKDGKLIYQIYRESTNMNKILPEYLSNWATEKIKSEGVKIIPNMEIPHVWGDKNHVLLTLSNGKVLDVDLVIVCVGVLPNTKLAEKSGLEIDTAQGGFLVNSELQARTDLYAAGDCACFYDTELGRRRLEHHDHAVVSGRLAGENMTGAKKTYTHQSMFWSDLGPDVGYEAIGHVDSRLATVGIFAKGTPNDTPKGVVTATNESDRSKTEETGTCNIPRTDEQRDALAQPKWDPDEDFGKGVIFYLRDDIVVGLVMWNVFNRMLIARQVLKDQRKYEDLNEVAKLFNIHED